MKSAPRTIEYGLDTDSALYRSVLVVVAVLHVIFFFMARREWPNVDDAKEQVVTIELSGSAPVGLGGAQASGVVKGERTTVQQPVNKTQEPLESRSKRESEGQSKAPLRPETRQKKASSLPGRLANQNRTVSGEGLAAGALAAQTSDVNYKAEHLHNAKPPYPLLAVQLKVEGVVIVRAHVLADGACALAEISTSSGNRLLDDSALTTIRTWRFVPAKKEGVGHDQWINIPITFKLKPQANQ